MNIVTYQSIKNTIITYAGFVIGAINTLFLYTYILGDIYYGLVGFILSSSNIMMPLMAFGAHNSLVKFYAAYPTEQAKSEFLTYLLFLPLLFVLPFSVVGYIYYSEIGQLLSHENPIIAQYLWIVPLVGLSMGYFEIFYAWVKVHLKSVFGSFLREVALRLMVSLFLILVYQQIITPEQFIYALVLIYFTTMVCMKWYAYHIKMPAFTFKLPSNYLVVLEYSLYIILSGSIAMLLLDIDKFMIAQYVKIENVAYYSVAIFISLVIAVPGRAMHQITYPITAKLMAENKYPELNELYKKSSITLQIVGGLVYLGILINLNQIYILLPKQYSGGIAIVFFVGLSKYFDLVLGNNNSIIFNSKYYKAVLFLGVMLTIVTITLNMLLIPSYGINGAAIATLISITLYSWTKLYFVVKKMNLYPFTIQTLKALGLLVVLFVLFYFWDFPFHPIISITLKTTIFAIMYLYLHYRLALSLDVNNLINNTLSKVFKK